MHGRIALLVAILMLTGCFQRSPDLEQPEQEGTDGSSNPLSPRQEGAEPSFDPGLPEAFEATYESLRSDPAGNRDQIELRMEGPLPVVDRDLQKRMAYVLSTSPPTFRWAFDAELRLFRIDLWQTSIGWEPVVEKLRLRQSDYYVGPIAIGLGYGLAKTHLSEGHIENGTFQVADNLYQSGRLLPVAIGRVEPNSTAQQVYRLVGYKAHGPMEPADVSISSPPLLNTTYEHALFPDEGVDLLDLGWTPKDAMDHLRAWPAAKTIFDQGGCVREFEVHASLEEKPDPTTPVTDLIWIKVETADRTVSGWRLIYTHEFALVPGTDRSGFGDPEHVFGHFDEDELYSTSCDRVVHGPIPMEAVEFFTTVEPYAKREGEVSFAVTRDGMNGGFFGAPDYVGLSYVLRTQPDEDESVTSRVTGQPMVGQDGSVAMDAWRGFLHYLLLPPGQTSL